IANDALDADTGPNGLQNRPVVTRIRSNGYIVSGELWSRPNSSYVVDVYAVADCHISGTGGAEEYLGNDLVDTDATGHGSWAVAGLDVVPGVSVTATATETGLVD